MSARTREPRGASAASTDNARRAWNAAYDAFPKYAADFAWQHVVEILQAHPGEQLYEIGFGSGLNLRWARKHGWKVAGCDVADAAMARGRAELPGADLRQESILDCSAPSATYDVVIDRAALVYVPRSDMPKAVAQVRRILKPGGIFFFNPYGVRHTWPFPDQMPPATKWDDQSVRRLLPDVKWEIVEILHAAGVLDAKPDAPVEHTLRVLARKR